MARVDDAVRVSTAAHLELFLKSDRHGAHSYDATGHCSRTARHIERDSVHRGGIG